MFLQSKLKEVTENLSIENLKLNLFTVFLKEFDRIFSNFLKFITDWKNSNLQKNSYNYKKNCNCCF